MWWRLQFAVLLHTDGVSIILLNNTLYDAIQFNSTTNYILQNDHKDVRKQ